MDISLPFPEKFLWCRDVGHSWELLEIQIVKDTAGREVHRYLGCARCTTNRIQRLTTAGYIIGNSYDYPEGYQRVGGGHLSKDDRANIRGHNVKRFLK
jgi:hypothetical protein